MLKQSKSILGIMLVLLAVSCQEKADKNPLLSKFDTPYQTPPFDKIKHEHYMPALDSAISLARHEIDAIVNNTEEPTFENTIEALDHSGKLLADVSNILFNLNEAETDSVLQQIVIEASPKLTDFSNDINLNPELFKRVKAVWEKRDSLKLTPEQMMLVDKTYKGFVRNGANLSEADKEKYRAISRELSELTVKFNQHVLAETNSYKLHITNEADFAGLPQSLIDAAAYTA